MITIRLPYETPPIRSNDRLDWHAKARVVKAVRECARVCALNQIRRAGNATEYPIDYPVTVTVVWEVTNNRVRDAGSSAPTGKAAIDGLVDAGVLLHDRHSIVTEERFRIEVGPSKGVRLEIATVERPQDVDCRAPGGPRSDLQPNLGESDLEPVSGPLRPSQLRDSYTELTLKQRRNP